VEVGYVPQAYLTFLVATGQGVPVGVEGHRLDSHSLAGEGRCRDGVAGIGEVPQPHRPITAAGGQGVPVGAEGHRVDNVGVAGEGC
jgi:hypothetical protein